MFNLGTPEIIIILAVALLLFGPKKLPEIGKSLGQGLRELRKASRDIIDSVNSDYEESEPKTEKETTNDASDCYRDA
jgi:TatA/E family protein of Tat protein translocase